VVTVTEEATMANGMRRRWWAVGGLLVVQGAALVASCSTNVGESDCLLLATTLGTVEQERCDGGDAGFMTAYRDTITYAANGNCVNITSVRDQDELEACVACLRDTSCYDAAAFCDDPDAATLPETCVGQLQL
jgi:hypothetical protein